MISKICLEAESRSNQAGSQPLFKPGVFVFLGFVLPSIAGRARSRSNRAGLINPALTLFVVVAAAVAIDVGCCRCWLRCVAVAVAAVAVAVVLLLLFQLLSSLI